MKNFSLYIPVKSLLQLSIKLTIINIEKAYNTGYYYDLRQKISRAKTIHDLVSTVKSISNRYSTSDDILNILVECFTRYPLRETELQKLSIWQQEYENTHDICNYASTVIWISVIYSINR